MFLRDASTIEAWIESSESVVKDEDLGNTIEEVEELIKRHNDFIKTVEAQEDKLSPIKRITKVGECTIASKINVTPEGVRLSVKLQLTAALCNEIWPQWQI